jgi:serine/threonine protein kinase/dipeptidyl aminopeptidase/acylaminoacyl peptidase
MITRERWQQIKALFDSAQACGLAERPGFLDEACGGDEPLRREVESLLAADASNEDFLSLPAYEIAAGMLAEGEAEFAAGQQIDRYTILAVLGSGGMGEVYLAQDGRLGRRIALKLISADFARDETRVRRFEQEASAALLINHPNVCVIHEIGITQDGRHFIAMEHVEGMTLRDRMTLKQLQLAEALQVAVQVALALEAAHAAGVVHRDIKPENIMRRPDGFIKVLDFGLAKLNEELTRPQDFHEASTARVRTEPGMRMGTVRYMSPEQLREASVDERTDIWSLGVVLYEMVTGNTPFPARTRNDTIALILGKQSPELTFADELSRKFQQVIRKALTKDRAQRYQTVTELAADLKLVRRELRRRTEIDSSPEMITVPVEPVGTKPQPTPIKRTIFFRLKSQAISTGEFLVSEIRQHKKAAIFTGLSVAVALLFIPPKPPPRQKQVTPTPPKDVKLLTTSGKSICAAISTDGKHLAYAEEKNGMQQLVLTGIATTGSLVVVPPGTFSYLGVTFSRDGNYLYFTRSQKGEPGVLYQLAIFSTTPRTIKEGVDSPITFSPNGDRLSFVRFNKANSEYSLMIAETESTVEQTIATRRDGNTFSVNGAAWSPDGKTIVCGSGRWDNGYHMSLTEVDVESRREKQVGREEWFTVLQVAWRDDSRLIVSAREQPTSPHQLWRISYPQGGSERLTTDIAEYRGVSLAVDKIVSVRIDRDWKIWVLPDVDTKRAVPIVSGVGLSYGVGWTGNGKLVFSSMAQGRLNLSMIDPDGANQTPLTVNEGDNYTPAASPDGRYIVFASNRKGSFNIWRMNARDGSNPKQVTFSEGNFYPSCSPDSQWVAYDNQSNSMLTVWKVPIEGGDPVRLTDKYRMPVFSPDNRFIACRYDLESGSQEIAIIPVRGGPPVKLVPIPVREWQRVQWSANGRALTFINTINGTSNIWSYDLNSGVSKQLTDFQGDQIFAYAWSPDYKQLACERGTRISNVAMISDTR